MWPAPVHILEFQSRQLLPSQLNLCDHKPHTTEQPPPVPRAGPQLQEETSRPRLMSKGTSGSLSEANPGLCKELTPPCLMRGPRHWAQL